jgi:hypothetical protein
MSMSMYTPLLPAMPTIFIIINTLTLQIIQKSPKQQQQQQEKRAHYRHSTNQL